MSEEGDPRSIECRICRGIIPRNLAYQAMRRSNGKLYEFYFHKACRNQDNIEVLLEEMIQKDQQQDQ